MAPINLSKASIVRPTILKGSRISQRIGKRKMKRIASGQHTASSKNQRSKANTNLMEHPYSKRGPPLLPRRNTISATYSATPTYTRLNDTEHDDLTKNANILWPTINLT